MALATGLLLLMVGVAFGVLIGPPPRTVLQPIEPATNVAGRSGGDRVGGRTGVTATTSASLRGERGGLTANDRVAAFGHDAATDPDRVRIRPIKFTRASAKRPPRAVSRPESVAIDFVSAPEPRDGAGSARSPEEISALARIAVQAP